MHDELAYLSAASTLALFRARSLSPVELLTALIERIEFYEPQINAVADRRYDEALAEAQAAEQRYLGRGDDPRPLEGVLVAAKEEHPMIGRSWTQGSLTLANEVATLDHPIIERIQSAGGIIHIRTTTPEFCCAGFCHSRMWGTTRNPWNLDYTPGGSSGGSGAALAAGYAALATGSDIGGSIRIPASFCGVVGFKPPFGRVAALPPYNLDQYCHDGPMARTVADCALLENAIAGPHWRDVASLRFPPIIPPSFDGVAGRRIALCLQLGDWPVDAAVLRNARAAADALADAGAIVEEVTLPWTVEQIWAAAQAHFATIMGAGIAHVAADYGDLLCDYTRAFAATMTSQLGFYEGTELEGRLWEPLGRLFESYDAMLCPTIASAGLLAGEGYVDGQVPVGDTFVEHNILAMMTLPFNLFSRCPVLSVPSGLAANGVPTGVQVVGRTYDDLGAFQVASALESAGFGFASPSWRPDLG